MAIIVDEFGNITNTDPRVVSEEQGLAGYTPGMGPMDPNDLFFQLPLNSLRGLDLSRFQGIGSLDVGGFDKLGTEGVKYDPEQEAFVDSKFNMDFDQQTGIKKLLQYLPFGDKSLLRRGFEGISSLIPRSDPRTISMQNFYGSRFGLTPTGQVASGIMAGYNPVSGFGKNKKFGLADAARKRIDRIVNRRIPQTDASRAKIKALQDFVRKDTASRARQAAPDVYKEAEKQGFIDSKTGGFKSAGTNEAFSNKTGRGRTGY